MSEQQDEPVTLDIHDVVHEAASEVEVPDADAATDDEVEDPA